MSFFSSFSKALKVWKNPRKSRYSRTISSITSTEFIVKRSKNTKERKWKREGGRKEEKVKGFQFCPFLWFVPFFCLSEP